MYLCACVCLPAILNRVGVWVLHMRDVGCGIQRAEFKTPQFRIFPAFIYFLCSLSPWHRPPLRGFKLVYLRSPYLLALPAVCPSPPKRSREMIIPHHVNLFFRDQIELHEQIGVTFTVVGERVNVWRVCVPSFVQ